ncbi:MAG: hypothetical protein ACFB6R_15710 [Alphaproteobacteria bacterium]
MVAPEGLMRQTMAHGDKPARAVPPSPRSLQIMKRALWEAQVQTLGAAVDVQDAERIESLESEDFREGVAPFVEGRPANFSGQ